jgi:PAS domain S-box-containing protein/putative nucleotidyltransferase with HDIG domain
MGEEEILARFYAIINSSYDAIIGMDLSGVITSWNPAAEKIFGYTAQEAIGQSIEIIIPPNKLQEESDILQKISKGKLVSHIETTRRCKDGQLIDVSITASPIINSNGKVIGVSKIARDISLQLQAQKTLYLNKALKVEKDEKAKRAEELLVINKELSFERDEKAKRAEELLVINKRLEDSLLETVDLARQLSELRDLYTSGHEQSVGNLACAIATEIGLGKNFHDGIKVAGYLHDIGKIIVPIEILVKPSRLDVEEFALVKKHVNAGYRILKDISFPWPIAKAISEHHERLDGTGYPNGLKGDEISMGGRILAVADVVDAMSMQRPYRPGLGIDAALAELKRGYGTIYDKTVVDACINLIKVKGYKVEETLTKYDTNK